jgi:hypothetical protein
VARRTDESTFATHTAATGRLRPDTGDLRHRQRRQLRLPDARQRLAGDRDTGLQGAFDSEEEHWARLAEIEPVVPPYDPGASFDGWIVLPIFAARSSYQIVGNGFQPRARLQVRASAYLVA